MANVQIDNGEFTRVANVILEKLSSAKLNGCQYAIVLVVLRFTYGFQRKEHDLSLTFIEKATGFDKRQVQRNLKLLEDSKIITQKVKSGITRIISFNKDYESWTYGELTHGKKTVGEKAYGKNTVGDTANLPIVTYGENAYQERKVLKENLKDIADTIKPPEIILQDEFCRIHNKGSWTLKQKEYEHFSKITSCGIPLDFTIQTMNQMHEHKMSKNEKVTSFSFYYESIIDAWNAKEGGKEIGKYGGNTSKHPIKNDTLEGWDKLIVGS